MIPLLIAGAVVGLGAHAFASSDNEDAKRKNEEANQIIEASTQIAQDAKQTCQSSIDELAREKTIILQGNMKRFVNSFSQIKPVNFDGAGELFEMARFNKNELTTMQTMVSNVQKVSVNDVVGGVSGTVLAVGAADMIAGGSLLGGLSVGGLAGGAALGAVAAPVFAITGIFSASEAAKNLEKAESNLAKAKAYQDECETYSYLAAAVSERCDLFYETLNKINITWFTDAVNQLERLVNSKKTFGNFFKNLVGKKIYTRQEMQTAASAAALAKMVKTIIDTNILDKDGQVTDESEKVILDIQKQINPVQSSPRISEFELQDQQIPQPQYGQIQQPQYGQSQQVQQPQYGQPQQVQQPQYGQPQQVQQPQYGQPQQIPQSQYWQELQEVQQTQYQQTQPPLQYGQPRQIPQPQYGQPQQQIPQPQYGQPQQQIPQSQYWQSYQQAQQSQYKQPQHWNNQVQQKDPKSIYRPNIFVRILMWAATIFLGGCGVLIVFGGLFICGVIWVAAGLIMCPKVNRTMNFWPRIGIMLLLLTIGCFFV